jgi:hypothetical protein
MKGQDFKSMKNSARNPNSKTKEQILVEMSKRTKETESSPLICSVLKLTTKRRIKITVPKPIPKPELNSVEDERLGKVRAIYV